MKVICVTGGDSRFFLHIVLFLKSFERVCPGQRVHVCDFGLTEGQIRYLSDRAEVLAMPESLRHVAHTWYRKGAINLYLRDVSFDALVWIDADCMVLSDVASELSRIAVAENAVLLACPDLGQSIADVIEGNERAGRSGIGVFKTMVESNGVSPLLPYVSVGVLICRSRPFLEEWGRATLQVAPHPMFEQNVFNVLAHKNGWLRTVDGRCFNVTGQELNRLSRREDGTIVNSGGEPVRVVHLTSAVEGVLDIIEIKINMFGKVLEGMVRRPTNPVLQTFQHGLIETLLEDAAALDACGLLTAQD
jgi:hypothetical protein